jgi:lipoprotein NlpD
MKFKQILLLIFGIALIAGCANYESSAPVRDINTRKVGKTLYHYVQPGETLYSVAWRYEKDYRKLAKLNTLELPYSIHPGELIQLTGRRPLLKKTSKTKQKKSQTTRAAKKTKYLASQKEPSGAVKAWRWPTKSHRVVRGFSKNNKGINIAGNYKNPVYSTAKGKVVYAGNSIRGYGNLLIVKHNSAYLTAYAYNSNLLVKEGQWVKAGQQIAQMGANNTGHVLLHFEIRKAGIPVNPLKYLS